MKKFGLYSLIASIVVAVVAFIFVIVPLPAGTRGALIVSAIWLFGPAIVGSAIFWKMDKNDDWNLRKHLK